MSTQLYLLSGFLGSGKTTLLKHLLASHPDKKIGIIMNEFGKISIDGPILEREGLEMVQLTRGSIFCSCLQISFVKAMVEMAEMDLDFLIVESSGLADPSNIQEILDCVADEAGDVYTYNGSLCMVDGLNFLTHADEFETLKRQIQCSQIAFISKTDLIEPEQVQIIKDRVQSFNSHIHVEAGTFGKLSTDFLGRDLTEETKIYKETLNTKENKPKTLHMSFEDLITLQQLKSFLEEVTADAFRIKGFARTNEGMFQVDTVGKHVRCQLADEQHEETILVFISKVGPQIIRTITDSWKRHCDVPMKLQNG